MDVANEVARRAYWQWVLMGLVGGLLLWWWGSTFAEPVNRMMEALGAVLAILSIIGLFRLGRPALTISSQGVRAEGMWRTTMLEWNQLESCGWLVSPQVSYSRELRFPLFKRSDRRLPTIFWVPDTAMGRAADQPPSDIRRALADVAQQHEIPYRDRIPNVGSFIYSASAVATIVIVAILYGVLTLR